MCSLSGNNHYTFSYPISKPLIISSKKVTTNPTLYQKRMHVILSNQHLGYDCDSYEKQEPEIVNRTTLIQNSIALETLHWLGGKKQLP